MELTKKLMDLYLKCLTQQQIADEVGVERTTITKILDKLVQDVKNGKYAEIHKMSNFQPFLYNVWNLLKPHLFNLLHKLLVFFVFL